MQFFLDNSIYVALVVALVVMLGILFYLMRLDGRLREMEKKSDR